MDAKNTLDSLLDKMLELGGSDLHIKSNTRAKSRISGDMEFISEAPLEEAFFEGIVNDVLSTEQKELLLKNKDLDSHYVSANGDRYRLNMFMHLNGYACVFRTIPTKILDIDTLALPQSVHQFVTFEKGLVLVTGTTGSGKSTTLAAIIDAINRTQKKHIITIEDPIEFVHTDKQCSIEQRDVGEHAKSFHSALKAALREDPDIILLGELRDMETIEIALHAANSGHLVFSTLHTLDAKETIDRVVGTFPTNEQNRIGMSLASVLSGVLCQRLVKKPGGGRSAAVEVMIATGRIRQLIVEKRNAEITDAIEEGGLYGMQTFDQALFKLYMEKRVSLEDALRAASKPSDLKLKISNSRQGADLERYDLKEADETEETTNQGKETKHPTEQPKEKPERPVLKLKR